MCLAIPGRVIEIKDGMAEVDYGGVSKKASTRLFENVKAGDCVLVHAGFIIQILDEKSGNELEEMIAEMMECVDDGK